MDDVVEAVDEAADEAADSTDEATDSTDGTESSSDGTEVSSDGIDSDDDVSVEDSGAELSLGFVQAANIVITITSASKTISTFFFMLRKFSFQN